MEAPIRDVWVYLSASPLLHLTLTVLAYLAGDWIFRKSGQRAFFNPVLLSILFLVSVLWLSETNYETYFAGAQFVHFMLGPATVALAVPLYRNCANIRRLWLPILVSILAGSMTAALSAIGIAKALGATRETLISLAPKSVTAPVAMGIAEKLGGLPSLTAALVVLTGVLGALTGVAILSVIRVKDDRARGFALGLTSHGIGTARAFQISDTAGAFSALAMGLAAVVTAVLLPLLLRWLFG